MSDQQVMTEVLGKIMQMKDATCLKTIQNAAKDRKNSLLTASASGIRVGSIVVLRPEHQNRKPYGAKGEVIKVNPKRFQVDFGNYQIYNVPKTMVQEADTD